MSVSKIHKKCIIKPLFGNGGKDIFFSSFNDPNLNVIIEKFLEEEEHFIIQKFIRNVSKGDKRVFIINGKIKGAISRLPKKGSILSNMSKGASAKKIEISQHEMKISKIVASELKKQNIYFAGIDFIQSKLIGDINVTSPTGLKTYYDLTGINLAKYFFDNI